MSENSDRPNESPDQSDLDLEQLEKREQEKKEKSKEFARMLDESFKSARKKLSVGDKVRSEILVLGKEDVFVSTGAMNDGVVRRKDLLDANGNMNHKVGDKIDLYVTQVRGSEIFLSPNPTSKNLADDLEDAFDMMLPVEGRVAEVCKGGFRVSIKGKLAFCPISQMDRARIEVPEEYVGKRFEFRITQFSEAGRNIVVSRRKLLDEQKDEMEGSFLSEHKAGDVVSGKIKRLEKFGAFIEVAPGLEGLAHISELSWSRVNEPQDVVNVGQEVQVKILKIESLEGKTRISLSIKQAGEQPESIDRGAGSRPGDAQAGAAQRFPVGSIHTGKVERKERYGLFVRLDEGVTGLLHRSKAMDRPDFAFDKLKLGDEIMVQIGELNVQERRISLELPKDPGSEDWKAYAPKKEASFGSLGSAFGDALKKSLEKKSRK